MAEKTNLERVKTLLQIDDNLQDDILQEIELNTIDQFKAETGADSVPDELGFIIREVMIKRYNRLGNEGMSSTSRTDLSITFSLSDFDEYDDILTARYSTAKENSVTAGRMVML